MTVKIIKDIVWANKKAGDTLEVVGVYFRALDSNQQFNDPNMIYICNFGDFINEIFSYQCQLIDGTIPKNWIFYTAGSLDEYSLGGDGLQLKSIMSYPEAVKDKTHLIKLYQRDQLEYKKALAEINN